MITEQDQIRLQLAKNEIAFLLSLTTKLNEGMTDGKVDEYAYYAIKNVINERLGGITMEIDDIPYGM